MKSRQVDHIGIAVHSIEESLPFYTQVLDLSVHHYETIASQGVKAAFVPAGGSWIELLEPLHDESPIARFLAKHGPGMHHIAYKVENLREALAEAREQGYRLIDEEPRIGGHGKWVAFLHPKSTHGVLVEFCQDREL